MATIINHPWHLSSTFFFFFILSTSLFNLSSSSFSYHHHRHLLQSNSPQNIETLFPSVTIPVFSPPPSPPNQPSQSPISPTPAKIPVTPLPPTKSTGSTTVTKAVVATAASTLVVSGLFFFFLQKYTLARRRRQSDESHKTDMNSRRDETSVSYNAFKLFNGNLKGLIVDENGLDVLYWRKLEGGGDARSGFRKEVLGGRSDEEKRRSGKEVLNSNSDGFPKIHSSYGKPSSPESGGIIRISSPPGRSYKSSISSSKILSESRYPDRIFSHPSEEFSNSSRIQLEYKVPNGIFSHHSLNSSTSSSRIQLERMDPNQIFSPTSTVDATNVMAMARPRTQFRISPPLPLKSEPPPQPPLPPPPHATTVKKNPVPPPPPPPIPMKKNPVPPPPPPPIPIKKNPVPPPPPPRAGSSKPPPVPPSERGSSTNMSEPSSMDNLKESSAGQMKLKPLHWDKVVANADHSMVWDKISSGSFQFDDNLMEALFGYVATNRKSTDENKNLANISKSNSNQPTQSCLLDPHKSQNIAIVLRSLALSRQEILDALLNGSGLNADTLEKLTKIAPTKDEETMILEFSGNPSKLADAESFLYHLFRTVPSPFLRLDAMLFKSTYDFEILHLKESLQILESACTELRRRGLFLKLLEATLKAGNRMNAGTARGNAQAFNLTALRKLSDVKSTDGKTTLLHFVVEEVVRAEGKRCVINRNHSLGRSNSNSSPNTIGKDEREKEYIMLGLPVVGGLSVEFSNVKKAATIDYDGFINVCAALTARVDGIRQFLGGRHLGGGDGFEREMKGFLEAAEEELKVVKEEEVRVMELVKRTTEYYQAGTSKDKGAHSLQLFVIVKDFLDMVDQVCVDIARSQQQKKKPVAGIGGSSPPPAPAKRIPVRFPNLPAHFMSDNSKTSSSSDSEDDF